MQYDSYENDLVQRAKDLESDAKTLRKQAEDSRRMRIKREESRRRDSVDALQAGSIVLINDISKAQGLGDYKFKLVQHERTLRDRGETVVVTLTLAPR